MESSRAVIRAICLIGRARQRAPCGRISATCTSTGWAMCWASAAVGPTRCAKGLWRPLFQINGDSVLHRSFAEDAAGNVYFGEYFMNPERVPVKIWRVSPDLESWEVACELPGVRHVHGIYADPYAPGTLWAAVGDFKGECYLMRSEDGFRSLQMYGDGSQIWRAVSLFFTEKTVNWLTDSNLELNHACRMDRADGKLEIGQEIDCSAWYGCTTREGLHVAFTTVEQGPGILSNFSSVLVSRDAFIGRRSRNLKRISGARSRCSSTA